MTWEMQQEKHTEVYAVLMDGTRVQLYHVKKSDPNRPVVRVDNATTYPYMQVVDHGHIASVILFTADGQTMKLADNTNGKGKTALEHAFTYVERYGKQNGVYEYEVW